MIRFRALVVAVGTLLLHGLNDAGAQVPVTGNPSVQLPNAAPGRVRGVVFDSLLMKPVEGVTVMLMEGMQSAKTDARGRFEIIGVQPGKHVVAFNTPLLDSLGLGTLGATVDVPAGAVVQTTIATPSFRTLWTWRCGGGALVGSDSGIVWGTIRDAETDSVVPNASAGFSWYDLRASRVPGLMINEIHKAVPADSRGQYFACGLPTEIVISSMGSSDPESSRGKASGTVQYAIGNRRLYRMDMLVSTDMVIPDSVHYATAADSVAADRARGTATMHGKVLDERQRPVANSIVEIASADTSVRTGKDGGFSITGLPAGTHVVQLRSVGFAPTTRVVNLRPHETSELDVQMSVVSTLTTINVRADLVKGSDRLEYESRRKSGVGYAVEAAALAKRVDLVSVLSMFPSVTVERTATGFNISMPGTTRRTCTPAAYLDGMPTDFEIVSLHRPDEFRAIEVFTKGGTVPAQYSNFSGCGSILFWSRGARW